MFQTNLAHSTLQPPREIFGVSPLGVHTFGVTSRSLSEDKGLEF